jgi:hypothetical protein
MPAQNLSPEWYSNVEEKGKIVVKTSFILLVLGYLCSPA